MVLGVYSGKEYVCATAYDLSGSFVTSDGEIKPVEAAEHAPILWFRPPKEKQAKKKTDIFVAPV
jgi:hypothetical protein